MAGTYYIDKTLGDDSGTGAIGDPWEYCPGMSGWSGSHTTVPNDFFLHKDDEEWEDILDFPVTGTNGNPITYGRYGSGTNKPVINGSDDVIGIPGDWTSEGSDVWSRSLTTECGGVVFDRTNSGIEDPTPDAQYEWDWVSNELFVYSPDAINPTVYYSSIEATQRNRCMDGSTRNYITIDGLELRNAINTQTGGGSSGGNIQFYNSTGVIVQNCDIYHPTARGVFFDVCTSCTVDNNLIDTMPTNNGYEADGVYFDGGNGGHVVSSNTILIKVDGFYVDGIQSYAEEGYTIEYNWIENVTGYAATTGGSMQVQIETTASESGTYNVRYNVVLNYTNVKDGFIIDGTGNETYYIYNNVIVNEVDYPVTIIGPAGGWTFRNNIMYANASVCLVSDSGITDHSGQLNYNCYFRVGGGDLIRDDGVPAPASKNWTEMQSAGYEPNGINADPLFVNFSSQDFHLQSGSPCRNVGDDVSLTQDYDGVSVPQEANPAIGAFEYIVGILSDYAEGKLLAHIFKNTSYSQPGNLYVALCKSTVEDDDTGSTLPSEISGGNYSRKQCNTWDTSGVQGHATNDLTLQFSTATAQWGIATDFAICDATSGGNMLCYGKLSESKNIHTGDIFIISTDDLDIALN